MCFLDPNGACGGVLWGPALTLRVGPLRGRRCWGGGAGGAHTGGARLHLHLLAGRLWGASPGVC